MMYFVGDPIPPPLLAYHTPAHLPIPNDTAEE